MNRSAPVFVGLILAWNIASVHAQPGPCLYFQANFQGEPMCIGRTQSLPSINGLGRGRIMSVNIPSDVRVTVCDQENLGGACYMLQGQVPDFGAIGPAGNVSSLMAAPANAANQPRPIQTPAPQQQTAPQQPQQQQGGYTPPPPTRTIPDAGAYTPPPPVRTGTVPLRQGQPAPSSQQPSQQQGGYQPPMPPPYSTQQQGGGYRPPPGRPLFPHQQGGNPSGGMPPPPPPSYSPPPQQTTAEPPPPMPNSSGRRQRGENQGSPNAIPAPSASPQTGEDDREERRALRKQCRNGDNNACARLGAIMSKRKERK